MEPFPFAGTLQTILKVHKFYSLLVTLSSIARQRPQSRSAGAKVPWAMSHELWAVSHEEPLNRKVANTLGSFIPRPSRGNPTIIHVYVCVCGPLL